MTKDEKRRLPVTITKIELTETYDIQVLQIEFLKGSDKVIRYLMPDKIFEAIAEYEENHLETDAKTLISNKGYYNQGW
ncbi:hypothetical protein [Sediminibacterium sp.]|uniref:hypothetical protein n=1 Tax=Sediminibacterium sp. TaxID=1917865 RepID=UPI0025E2EC32|nr:hypothetical protein [Sediminibacterium sp.]